MSSDFITLKEKINLADYIAGRTGGEIREIGTDILDLSACPFCGGHECFRITPSKQSFHCFQCPGEIHGDLFDFVQSFDNCSKAEALEILAKDQGIELTRAPLEKVKRTPEEEKARQDQKSILEAAAAYYHAELFNNAQAIGYQRKVRMHTDATLKAFRVGHTDGRLWEHLQGKGYTEDQIIEAGLAKRKEDRLYDLFGYDLFIYPHLDKTGGVAGFTIKDKKKKFKHRLANEHWLQDCIFHNMSAFKGKEIFLVEGENDLLTVYGRGGLQHVAAINGQISKGQIEYLREWAPGKTIYLCFDNDDKGKDYTDKVCNALKDMCLPGTLAGLLGGDVADVRLIRFGKKGDDIDEYLKSQGDPAGALKGLVEGSERYYQPLPALKELYSIWVGESGKDRKFNYDTFGKICFEWFQARGKFYVIGEDCHLYYNNQTYKVANNTPFKALLYSQAGVNAATPGAKLIVQNIESQAYLKGHHTSTLGWIYTNFDKNTVYFNLCSEYSNLLTIGPGKIEHVPNGINAKQVLLRQSPMMHPLNFVQNVNVKKGMASLQTNLFENLACDIADRYFITCQLFNVVLLQYVKARGLMKFSGTKGCGKTSAASMLSVLIYGEDCVTTGSAASDFSDAAVSPLVISDNLESDAVRGDKRDFLLTSATGVTRKKRKAGTDSDNVFEKSCTHVIVTAIEPFVDQELINRTNEILFDKRFHNPAFKEAIALENDLREARDIIWSTIFKIISTDILPDIEQKKTDALKMIKKDFPNHSKERMNELYALLYLILDEVVKYIIPPGSENNPSREIFNKWITEQNLRAATTEEDTNKILSGLEALVSEYERRPDSFEIQYGVMVLCFRYERTNGIRKITLITSTKKLNEAFRWLAKERGFTNPYNSAAQLGSRINDSLETLKNAGWEFTRDAKKIRGERHHLFTRVFEE